MQMDIDVQSSLDVNNSHDQLYITPKSTQNLSVDKLMNDVTKSLYIQDDKDDIPGSKSPHSNYEKYFTNPTTSNESNSSPKTSLQLITSKESTPCNNLKSVIVSAMKGSREKRGVTPPQKLTVKWAPDVYDPVPTSVSHTVTKNKSHKQTKKNSKAKQKKGSKSGSKYKEKKQGRKRGGPSSSFKAAEVEDEVVVGLPPVAMEFHVGNPDQFCGTSFLKRYDTNQVRCPSF